MLIFSQISIQTLEDLQVLGNKFQHNNAHLVEHMDLFKWLFCKVEGPQVLCSVERVSKLFQALKQCPESLKLRYQTLAVHSLHFPHKLLRILLFRLCSHLDNLFHPLYSNIHLPFQCKPPFMLHLKIYLYKRDKKHLKS